MTSHGLFMRWPGTPPAGAADLDRQVALLRRLIAVEESRLAEQRRLTHTAFQRRTAWRWIPRRRRALDT